MKNVMKFGVALAVFFTAFTVRANDNDFTIRAKEGAGKAISFTITEVKDVHVSLYANDGSTIFDENIKGKSGSINRTYDLNALPDGIYFLETETTTKVVRNEIKISGKTATVTEKTVAEILKPVVTTENEMVTVKIAKNDSTPITIKMYDEANNELYSETFTGEQGIAKKFDISKLSDKNFTLVMTYSNKQFAESITAR